MRKIVSKKDLATFASGCPTHPDYIPNKKPKNKCQDCNVSYRVNCSLRYILAEALLDLRQGKFDKWNELMRSLGISEH